MMRLIRRLFIDIGDDLHLAIRSRRQQCFTHFITARTATQAIAEAEVRANAATAGHHDACGAANAAAKTSPPPDDAGGDV